MVRFTDEAAALLPNERAPHSLARWYSEQVRECNMVSARDVKRVYAAFRMVWEWESYCAAVYAGNPKHAYELSNTEGVIYGSKMADNPSDKDIPHWVEFLDLIHCGADWWSLIDDFDSEESEF